ncbi:hypothetical protein [uncultured Polaribacter sp.]|uniref:hypothetical protein n=1 Tax=uncultured Polaribacter sp. TaxID=174711 RepID=UPI002619EE54|nr:hypothetical protein [uncultured Polaribacter sp.]
MKSKILKLTCTALIIFFGFQTLQAQQSDVASNETSNYYQTELPNSNSKSLEIKETLLEEGKYVYSSKGNEVIVEIKDGYYTEYHANNEYIKAKIEWSAENKYTLEIIDINKDNLPFEVGTKMDTEIVKIKGTRIYYESNLEGLTWSGKFRKI